MKTQAAICWERRTEWSVEEAEHDPPKAGEVLVRIGASGLCVTATSTSCKGGFPFLLPIDGGHEGAGPAALREALDDVRRTGGP
ncbi:hypothetical protein [Jatrophihabitans lederbergiae]|jgi:Zn-dependent alcohol dehydrogenase|uniref:Alcohol dehydrogenase N-terminal domain-containing protein n=1 Tax=Jatrophihabitans lederbergiae TaxID=3075547 RepID=A0ABU2JFK7_9ACTN|nr:hypothetical protein [Jatrophihabitans sp. DSM 44399]MDT0263518.1 hypothetical protein [Jatrophihabitans sp. DSM 44399]